MNHQKPFGKFLCILLLIWLVSFSGTKACDRSEMVLDSIVAVGNEYDIHLTLCVGGGVLGINSGASGATTDIFFAFFSCLDSLRFSEFTPSLTADSTGTTLTGVNMGPIQSGPLQNQGLIQYMAPVNSNFMCISNTNDCGQPHTQCFSLRFRVDAVPDSIVAMAVEGDGNPVSGCLNDPDNTIHFDSAAFACDDTTAPAITCPVDQYSGDCQYGDYTGIATVLDDEDPFPTVTQSPAPGGTIFGTPAAVTLTATDWLGNASTCTFDAYILDTIAPDAQCQNLAVVLDTNGQAVINYQQLDSASTDGCGIAFFTISQNTFTCLDLGWNPVVMTVTDFNFNQSTCTSMVWVEDTTLNLDLPADTILCDGDSISLDAGAAVSYVWSTGDSSSSVTVSAPATYAVTVTSPIGCRDWDSVQVATANSPVAAFTMGPGSGNMAIDMVYGATGDITEFIWDFGDGDTSTALNPSHSYALPGTYNVCLVVGGPCGYDSTCQSTVVTSAGFSAFQGAYLLAYPNPAQDRLWLEPREGLSGILEVAVYDLRGMRVLSSSIDAALARSELDVGTLPSGMYYLRYESDGTIGQVPIRVQR